MFWNTRPKEAIRWLQPFYIYTQKGSDMPPLRLSPFAAVIAAALLVGCEQKSMVSPEESYSLTRPVARFESQAPADPAPAQAAPVVPEAQETPPASTALSPSGHRTGEEIYNIKCSLCHATGVAGAPKNGDRAAWAPRIATGYESLVLSVLNGKNAMPPRAGFTDLTDDEIRRAVAWQANQAGAQFAEPPVAR